MQKFLVLKKRPTEALFKTLETLLFLRGLVAESWKQLQNILDFRLLILDSL